MKQRLCPVCQEMKNDDSPYQYTWWHVIGWGLMCYSCHDKWQQQIQYEKVMKNEKQQLQNY